MGKRIEAVMRGFGRWYPPIRLGVAPLSKKLLRMGTRRREALALSQSANGVGHAFISIIPWYFGYQVEAFIYCLACLFAWTVIVVATMVMPSDWLR